MKTQITIVLATLFLTLVLFGFKNNQKEETVKNMSICIFPLLTKQISDSSVQRKNV
jgi:hypothetical protein